MYNPEKDGIDHLNVYSKGKTELGRFLTNFAYSPIRLETDGKFASIEGYWYWLSCHDDNLRSKSGFAAKQYGRSVETRTRMDPFEFKNKIKIAINFKLSANSRMRNQLENLEIPLTHYYVFGEKVIQVPENKWVLEHLESFIR